ncbi:MAG: hypothetical protein QNJ60_20810 [Xenococcaceae cyanobacterium MO_188.B19]|nr:hypothetical protein [Xenococcaceae cyanobacterium MO_188.B19]
MKKSLASLLIVVLLSIVLVLGNNRLVKAQSITTLNAEIIGLRTKVNRLESEVRNLRRSISSNRITPNIPQREVPSSTINNPPAIDNTVVGRSDPLFQRLATLVIELKEDVRNLDQRLEALEAKQKPNS